MFIFISHDFFCNLAKNKLTALRIGTPHYMAPEIMRGHGYGTEANGRVKRVKMNPTWAAKTS